jgi:hypothetical protein
MIFCLHLAKPLHNLSRVTHQEWEFIMNSSFRTNRSTIAIVIFLICALFRGVNAQNVKEPPIPVYIVCPYHQDSSKKAYENSIAAHSSALASTLKKYDTLQIQAQKSSAENAVHFTWLYALSALLGTMIVILLFSTSRIRKEIGQLRNTGLPSKKPRE